MFLYKYQPFKSYKIKFKEEWFELEHKGLTRGKVSKVPSVYQENQEMQREKTRLQSELDIRDKSLDKTRYNFYTSKNSNRTYIVDL